MISIVTITYNDFNGLKRTLSSIPDFDFIESVVIKGGSDKATIDILSSHKGKVINEKDEGIADAFNKGIVNSSGDAIMFLNSGDELIEPMYLKESEQILKTNKEVAFVHSNLILIDSIGTELYMRPQFCNLGRGLPYLHPTMIVRKSVFDQIGLFNKNYKIAMDFDFIVRLEQKGCIGTADVVAAVRSARDHDLEIAIRGGGHNVAGTAVCDDGIVIDLSAMRGVRVDPADRRAWCRVVPCGATSITRRRRTVWPPPAES